MKDIKDENIIALCEDFLIEDESDKIANKYIKHELVKHTGNILPWGFLAGMFGMFGAAGHEAAQKMASEGKIAKRLISGYLMLIPLIAASYLEKCKRHCQGDQGAYEGTGRYRVCLFRCRIANYRKIIESAQKAMGYCNRESDPKTCKIKLANVILKCKKQIVKYEEKMKFSTYNK